MWPAPVVLSKPWEYFSSNSLIVVVLLRSRTRSTSFDAERATTSLLNSLACFVEDSVDVLVAKHMLLDEKQVADPHRLDIPAAARQGSGWGSDIVLARHMNPA